MDAPDLNKITWQDFRAGDRGALQNLYKQHYLGLVNYGIKLTGNRQQANDYLVEMLLLLWEKRSNLPEVENVRSYLLTCLRTTIYQHVRSEKLREVKETHAHSLTESFEFSYEDHISRLQSDALLKARLLKSMGKLTARQKELLQLKFFDDLSYDEIAAMCDISKRTAYNIIYDALKIMKDDLRTSGYEHLQAIIPLLGPFIGALATHLATTTG